MVIGLRCKLFIDAIYIAVQLQSDFVTKSVIANSEAKALINEHLYIYSRFYKNNMNDTYQMHIVLKAF